MNQLIRITLSDDNKQTADARDLHKFLGSKQDFSTWIKSRIEQYGFTENQDFTLLHRIMEQVSGSKYRIEYYISLDMAKELSMVERTAKGKEARQYFIECENKLKQTQHQLPQTFAQALTLAAQQAEKLEQQQLLLEVQAPKVVYADTVAAAVNAVNIRDWVNSMKVSEGLQVGERVVVDFLLSEKYLYRNASKSLRAFAQHHDLFTLIPLTTTTINGAKEIFHLKITGVGQVKLTEKVVTTFK